jgi:hypothetical protein
MHCPDHRTIPKTNGFGMASRWVALPWDGQPVFSIMGDDASTTVPETCRVLGITQSSYYVALREERQQALNRVWFESGSSRGLGLVGPVSI